MLAQKNEYLKETVSGIRKLTEDEKIRQQCKAREDFEYWERIKRNHDQQELWVREEALRKKEEVLQEKEAQLAAALARIGRLLESNNNLLKKLSSR